MWHFVEPWRDSFQEIAEFLTGHQAEVADDRVLATVLFTDIVDSTRRAAEIGDRDWHALLDAHDAVVRAQLNRFRGREVNTSGDGFLAMFDGPQRAIRCAMAFATRCILSASRCGPGCTPANARYAARTSAVSRYISARG
jgi:class 3 adenylate cyclase